MKSASTAMAALIGAAALAGCSVNPDRVTGGPDQSPLISLNLPDFRTGGSSSDPTGVAAAPEVPVAPAAAEDRLVSAIEAQGCVLTSANVDSVLLSANLTADELRVITEQLVEAGRAELSGEGAIRILSTNCI
ncbi:hypothetical protein [Pseudoroseicyclus tamaricis]|uniref:Uncharacterized protein n=1 Tax=Pseudoroseicyclus tamaricis TaxID=2705421 RepID=A0A6B2JYU9_9RHOB|nr:hypothetical protein [Pseudoroseicyclus tamaricis]NDV01474.1 hypothetical protein [Pseudoroseicyclus tamaricis]